MMPDRKDVMMSVPEGSFGDQIHLEMLRQLIVGMGEINKQLHSMNELNMQTVQRLTALEQNPVSALEARLVLLEAEEQKRKGAASLVAWCKDYTPWLLAIVMGALAYFSKNGAPIR